MSSTFEETQQPHRHCGLVKRICHSCKCETEGNFLVPCHAEGCHKFFCRRCLTSRYKFSKAKAAHLPSFNWRCPACTRRCYCADCVETGTKPKQHKPIKKLRVYVRRGFKRKRQRIKKSLEASGLEAPLVKYNSWLVVGARRPTLTCRTCGCSYSSPCPLSETCSSCSTPQALRPCLPALSSIPNLSLTSTSTFTANSTSTFMSASAPFPYSKVNETRPTPWLYDLSTYEKMSLLQLLKIAAVPFTQSSCREWSYSCG